MHTSGCHGRGNNSSGKPRLRFQPSGLQRSFLSSKLPNGTTEATKHQDIEEKQAVDMCTFLRLFVIKLFIFLYDFLTFPIYFVVQQPWKRWKAFSTPWAKQIRENDPYSPCVRVIRSCINPLDGINTVDELFRMSVVRYGTNKCLGVREVLAEAEEYYKTGKIFKKLRLGEYKWFSYLDVDQRIEIISKGLLAMGVQPKQQVVIFAETRMEWMLLCQACFRINVPVATLYSTLGEDGIAHGMNETEVSYVFTSQELLPKLRNIMPNIPGVSHIVFMEDLKPADTTGFPDKVSLIPFSQLENMGVNCDPMAKPDPPGPNDLAIIMYTSGSTGIPKGVMLTHKNIVTTSSGLLDAIPRLKPTDVYIGYLPLAHVLEISAECFFFVMGVPVGYSSPHTMTDKSTAVMAGCKGDASLLMPTIMTAVPLMLDRIRKSVNEVAESKGAFAKEFFNFAVNYKQFWWRKGFETPILNKLVFKKIQELVGGRVRIMACGGAPLSPDTHDFIRTCLNVKLIQAYGMTETAASATIMALNDYSTGRVGAPLSSCYIRLVDWIEGGYQATDKPYPRGEIVIGGDCVTLGYFKNDLLTKESYVEEDGIRWFYTGDIGEMYPDGTFKIVDRKKDLVKLQYGEYVSLGKVEAELKTCPLVDNICVIGNGFHDYLVALVVPNLQQLTTLATTFGKQNLAFQELCQDAVIISAVTKAMTAHGQKCRLLRTEIPAKVKLCTEEWQPDTGLVTAAFKLRRKVIQQYYENAIDEMYTAHSNGTSKST